MRVKVLQTKAYLHLHVYSPYPNTCIRVQYEGILLNMAQIQVSAIHWSTMILAFWYLPNSLPYFKVIWKSIFSNLKNGKKKNWQCNWFFSLPQWYLYFIVCATQTEAGSHNRVLNHNSETLWLPQLQQQVSSLYRGTQQSRCPTRVLTPSSNSSWNNQSQLSIFVWIFFFFQIIIVKFFSKIWC